MINREQEISILRDNPLFSVLIANYNNGRYIQEAIDSVRSQIYSNWEIVIVDDDSSDNSIEIIQSNLADPRIKLFRNQQNGGCGYTKKRCIDEAQGDLCAYLDPDDALVPEALGVMVKQFLIYPDSGIINSRNYYCDENLNPEKVNPYSKEVPNLGPYILYNDGSVTHFAVFRRDFYQKTSGLSPNYKKAVDQDLYLLMDQTGPIRFCSDVLYLYRIHKGGISTFDNVIPATYQHFRIIKDYSSRYLLGNRSPKDVKKAISNIHRSNFHLAMLERKRMLAVFLLLKYAFHGGSKEVKEMFIRLITHPKRVFNSITKIYTVKPSNK